MSTTYKVLEVTSPGVFNLTQRPLKEPPALSWVYGYAACRLTNDQKLSHCAKNRKRENGRDSQPTALLSVFQREAVLGDSVMISTKTITKRSATASGITAGARSRPPSEDTHQPDPIRRRFRNWGSGDLQKESVVWWKGCVRIPRVAPIRRVDRGIRELPAVIGCEGGAPKLTDIKHAITLTVGAGLGGRCHRPIPCVWGECQRLRGGIGQE
jgi:hypothetical protein